MNKYVQNVRKFPFKPFHVLTVFHLHSTMRTAHLNIKTTAFIIQHTYISYTVSADPALGPKPAISKKKKTKKTMPKIARRAKKEKMISLFSISSVKEWHLLLLLIITVDVVIVYFS